jgi:hypothetical protein
MIENLMSSALLSPHTKFEFAKRIDFVRGDFFMEKREERKKKHLPPKCPS